MTLVKLVERDIRHWGKSRLPNEVRVKRPSDEELETILAMAKINGIDTVVTYK